MRLCYNFSVIFVIQAEKSQILLKEEDLCVE